MNYLCENDDHGTHSSEMWSLRWSHLEQLLDGNKKGDDGSMKFTKKKDDGDLKMTVSACFKRVLRERERERE